MNFNLTLIMQAVAFTAFIWFCARFIWPPLMRAIEARQKQVAEGLAAAEKGRQTLDQSAREAEKTIAEARARAAEIVAQGEKRAAEIVEEAKQTGRTEGERLVTGAQAEIEQSYARAREALREQVAQLAVAGAEKILRREVDAKVHADLLAEIRRQL